MIRIILIDDHFLVRAGLREIFASIKGIQVIGEASTGKEGIEEVRRLSPDLVLLDLKLPDMDGLSLTQTLLNKNPDIKILILSSIIQDLTVLRLLEAGAQGYVSKSASAEELLLAIKTVQSGQRFISPKLASRLALTKVNPDKDLAFAKITDRERQVMEQMIRGIPVKEIANQLNINHKTVHSYRDRIFEKLGVNSDVDVTLLAIYHGLLVIDASK